jgi:hypothetical protein
MNILHIAVNLLFLAWVVLLFGVVFSKTLMLILKNTIWRL